MLFVISQGLSLFAEELVRFALPVVYFLRTGNAFGSSILYCCVLTPRIFLGSFLGYLGDYFSPQIVFKRVVLAQTVLISVIPILDLGHSLDSIFLCGVISFILSILNSIQYGAVQVIQPRLFDKTNLMGANGLITSFESIALLLSPIIAGILLDISGLPLLCYFASLINVFSLIIQRRFINDVEFCISDGFMKDWKKSGIEGLSYILKNQYLFCNLLFTCPVNLILCVALALFIPMLLKESNHASVLGLVIAMGSVGQLLGGLCCKYIGPYTTPEKMLYRGFLIGGWSLWLAGSGSSSLNWIISFFLLGFGVSILNASNQTIWQLLCPANLRGRVISTRRSINSMLAPLGFLIAVPLANALNPVFLWFDSSNPYSIVFIFCGTFLLLFGGIFRALVRPDGLYEI